MSVSRESASDGQQSAPAMGRKCRRISRLALEMADSKRHQIGVRRVSGIAALSHRTETACRDVARGQPARPRPAGFGAAAFAREGRSSVAETAKTAQTQKIAEKQSLGDGSRTPSQTAETAETVTFDRRTHEKALPEIRGAGLGAAKRAKKSASLEKGRAAVLNRRTMESPIEFFDISTGPVFGGRQCHR
jgi:hypothetical protein